MMNCSSDEDEAEVNELERFDDFTLASSWERFISEIEAVCRRWMADGPKNLLEKGAVLVGNSNELYKTNCELKYDKKSYCMEYYFKEKRKGKVTNWDPTWHHLQLAFGVTEFLIIAPQSASGVVLNSPEASKLLSAVAIAMSNCCSLWPAFVPVHDPSRKAHIGIQNMGTVFTRRFESDCIKSQVPVKLMHLEGLYELFVSKFAFSTQDFTMYKVQFTMKLTYRTLPCDDDDDDDYMREAEAENAKSSAGAKGELVQRSQWDDDCPWSEWYSAEDPVKGFDLVTIWSDRTVESSLEMAEIENSSPHEAKMWHLLPIILDITNDGQKVKTVGFASQLSLLVVALEMSFEAQFLEDFVTVDSRAEKLRSSASIPPPTVVARVLKELFHEGVDALDLSKGENKSSRAIKGAPAESLFAQFCLNSLWLGNCNIRAIAMLWIEFVREVRWCWEESQPLPRIPVNDTIDLSSCLIHQKLQMLVMCIEKKREANAEFFDATEDKDSVPSYIEEDLPSKPDLTRNMDKKTHRRKRQDDLNDTQEAVNDLNALDVASDRIRRGSAGVAGSMTLLSSCQKMHAPFTQDAPPMTEDIHDERLNAVAAFGDSFSFSAQLEKEILSSDMSAFKAANPDAVFEDFIRWHSPGDWINDDIEGNKISGTRLSSDWPPKGRLSKRMSDHGNFWRKLWNDAPALAAYEQKPLLDPNREGEKILHYLETLRPHQLLEQMVCTAFRASADTLNQASFGDLNQMKSKLNQFYLTMASMLRPLQANQLSQDSDIFEDLKRLCVIFEHVERLTVLAVSLYRKFILTPRLFNAIFSDYYNFYLPRMGKSEVEVDFHKEFDQRQQVWIDERNAIADLFIPPTSNQSWRKVLSMGNLLNGHEPVLREIIFKMCDDISDHHYATHNPLGPQQDVETYRMYIEGTSNDLGVSLSVVSCD
ncbi:rab3 GTPase-activating protein catalytic subunit-like isoform X2 [Chenopodium quinoa]|uniref:rab3 GTPase-activating protein catalytic subunit-like isoform X2 n=1 Tax=Chenopodium quinoa TaxID=63459 RepID=UPI000B770D69|nr:rab3 GTPase-activating protein catalytic subunit-like isoform X2 [Chenopodium quinoa]